MTPPLPRARAATLSRLASLPPFAAAAALLAACAITSARRHFWHDEVFSWTLVTDPSITHMLRAIAGGAEAAPPVYHLGARAWLAIAGKSELALRMWSSLGFAGALLIFWRTLRRAFTPPVAAFASVAPFCLSPLLWYQNAEARFYGTFMLAVALATWATVAAASEPRRGRLVVAVVAHAVLVLSHIFGFFYSGALLAAVVAHELTIPRGVARSGWRVPVAIVAGWSAFAAWLPAFLVQMEVGKPHTWIPVPTFRNLKQSYGTPTLRALVLAALLIGAAAAIARTIAARRGASVTVGDMVGAAVAKRLLLWIAAALLGVPVLAFIVSHTVTSVFVDRYLLPGLLAYAIVIAWALDACRAFALVRRRGENAKRGAAIALAVLALLLTAMPLRWALARPRGWPTPGIALRRASDADGGIPVIAESPLEYLPAVHYAGAPARPFHVVLDWPSALDPSAALQATVDYKMMANWRRWGYLANGIVGSDAVLCGMPRFIVVDEPGRLWFDRRIATDSAFRTQLLWSETDSATGWWRPKRVLLVTRVGERARDCGVPPVPRRAGVSAAPGAR